MNIRRSKIIFFILILSLAFTYYVLTSKRIKIPKSVQKDMKNQIETIIGKNKEDFKGIPLLDGSINCADYKKWPQGFFFAGEKYSRKDEEVLSDGPSGGHTKHIIDYPVDNQMTSAPSIDLASVWSSDNTIKEIGLSSWTPELRRTYVFDCQFYDTGKISSYSRDDLKKGVYQTDYFDKKGKVIGSSISFNLGQGPTIYEIEGKRVDPEEFFKKVRH